MKKTTTLDTKYMREALKEAQIAATENEIPIGAVIVCQERIIARGHNQTERLHDPTAHAEMIAITSAVNILGAKYLSDCQLYVTVEPCIMCAGAIGWSQLSKIVFGTEDPKRGYKRFAPQAFHPKAKVIKGILEEECKDLMTSFFKNKR